MMVGMWFQKTLRIKFHPISWAKDKLDGEVKVRNVGMKEIIILRTLVG